MQYVGVDIIEITRIEGVVKRWGETFLQRVFTPAELKLYQNPSSLAVRFAAKEAVWKAFSKKKIALKDISVVNTPEGKPEVKLKKLKNLRKKMKKKPRKKITNKLTNQQTNKRQKRAEQVRKNSGILLPANGWCYG